MANELLPDEIDRLGPHVQGKSCWICDPNGTNCDVLFFARRLIKARKSQQRSLAVKDMMKRGLEATIRDKAREFASAVNAGRQDRINQQRVNTELPPPMPLRAWLESDRSRQVFEQIRTLNARLDRLQVEHELLRAEFDRHRLR